MGNIPSNKIEPDNEYDKIFVLCLDKMEKGTLNYNPEIMNASTSMNIKCNYCNLNILYICKNKWMNDKINNKCDSCNNLNDTYIYSYV